MYIYIYIYIYIGYDSIELENLINKILITQKKNKFLRLKNLFFCLYHILICCLYVKKTENASKYNNIIIHLFYYMNGKKISKKNKKISNKLKCTNNLNTNSNSNTNTNLNTDIDTDTTNTNSDELSDELNSIIGIKKNNPIENNPIENEFDVNKIYQDIYTSLSKYKFCKITGEIIKFKITDGNAWIDIKFKEYQVTGVFWKIIYDSRFNDLKTIKSGDQIKFNGNFAIMKKNLNIYFNVKSMEKFGKGDYLDLYDQYRIKIKELNLGLEKKKLNKFPYTIGIITALEGAAIQDIIQTLKLDNFIGNVIIKNSIVQGSQCPKSIINSIEWFEQNYQHIDLLMITRGGGGYEDLVGFSNWDLLIKISNTPFITLSAIGHQIDNQLSDEISDYKFATPSIGAKFIVEKQQYYKNYLSQYTNSLNNIISNYLSSKNKFDSITINYTNIIKKYDIKNMSNSLKKYQLVLNKIINQYTFFKNDFYSWLVDLKPTITRNNSKELISICDFVDIKNNKEIKPKKIEINFIDGMVNISYKIIEYEQFEFSK